MTKLTKDECLELTAILKKWSARRLELFEKLEKLSQSEIYATIGKRLVDLILEYRDVL